MPQGSLTGWPTRAAIALGLVLSAAFLATPLRPWPDQGVMLEAALRHAGGLGLSTTQPTDDIVQPAYRRLVYFPPLYPLMVSAIVQLGAPGAGAVKGLNVAALVVGIFGWCSLAARYVTERRWRMVFIPLLVVAAGGTIPKGGTADLILWAGMPFWFLLLASAVDSRLLRPWTRAVAAGTLVGALIGIRWAAVFLVPAGLLFLLARGRGLATVMKLAAAYAIPPVAAYAMIVITNRLLSHDGGTLLSYTTPGWHVTKLLTIYPFEATIAAPIGLDVVLRRLWRMADPGMTSGALHIATGLLVPVTVAAAVIWRIRRVPRPAEVDLSLVAAVTLIAFLAWMTIRHNWSHVEWSYLEEPRYFRPMLPATLLASLWACGRLPRRAGQLAMMLLVLSAGYLVQAHLKWQHQLLSTPDESWELVRAVAAKTTEPGMHVVFDIDVSDYVVNSPPGTILRVYGDESEAQRLLSSRPAHVWIVRRVNEHTAFVKDPLRDWRTFEALRGHFGADRVWSSSHGSFEIYRAWVEPRAGEGNAAVR